ncbi:MAG TPA: hypothetical protein VGL35_15225 [Rhizomicrobium sp.]|jgi:ElaB/YqjD/DUF883 family membrane-anchored ribosome-binding protein
MGIFRRRTKNDVRKIADQLESLQSELTALRKDARKLTDGLSRTADAAVTTAEAAYDGVGNWTTDNVGLMREWSRNQPLTACLLSLGAGAVLGALFLRR